MLVTSKNEKLNNIMMLNFGSSNYSLSSNKGTINLFGDNKLSNYLTINNNQIKVKKTCNLKITVKLLYYCESSSSGTKELKIIKNSEIVGWDVYKTDSNQDYLNFNICNVILDLNENDILKLELTGWSGDIIYTTLNSSYLIIELI